MLSRVQDYFEIQTFKKMRIFTEKDFLIYVVDRTEDLKRVINV